MSFAHLDSVEYQGPGYTVFHDTAIEARLVQPPKQQPTTDEINFQYQRQLMANRVNGIDLKQENFDQLSELEDEDDEVLQLFRQKRLKELKQQQLQQKQHVRVIEIQDLQFESQVKQASVNGPVVLLLYMPDQQDSKRMLDIFNILSIRHPHVKFTRLIASQHIANFPLSACPTVMSYVKERVVGQWSRLEQFAGQKTDVEVVEWMLSKRGILETELQEDPRQALKQQINKSTQRLRRDLNSDSDED